MKAITIWQPWATLIMAGFKPFEFRGWPVPKSLVGQRIVIHAGARALKRTEVNGLLYQMSNGEFVGGLDVSAMRLLADIMQGRRQLPTSAGLGTAVLGAPKKSFELWPDEFKGLSDSDRAECSNWAWPLTDVQHFTPIVPARGAQGFWNWPWSGGPQ